MGEAVLLHNFPEYIAECCTLLNEEWPRSGTSRLESLKKSCDALPCSIILLAEERELGSGRKVLIGHSRLARVLGRPNACWIESVIVKKDRRGQGLGQFLMSKTEEHAVKLKFVEVHLSTRDKLRFYAKLGYERSTQTVCVSSASSSLMSNGFFSQLERCHGKDSTRKEAKVERRKDSIVIKSPPPPPPPPVPSKLSNSLAESAPYQTWMVKHLIQAD